MKSVIKRFFSGAGDKIKVVKVTDSKIKNFGLSFSQDEMHKYLDPFGFLNKDEKEEVSILIKAEEADLKKNNNKEDAKTNDSANTKITKEQMPKEYGMKPKGPEPTRYGDWERNGKCVDF